MTKITIERETLERAIDALECALSDSRAYIVKSRESSAALRAALAAQPAEPTMDTVLRNAARRSATVIHPGRPAALPAPAAVPLTNEKIDHTLATTLDEFARTTRGMSHALDVNADITANSRLRRMFARAVLAAAGDKP